MAIRCSAEHASIDAMTAIVHAEDLGALAEQRRDRVDLDRRHRAAEGGLLGGLLGASLASAQSSTPSAGRRRPCSTPVATCSIRRRHVRSGGAARGSARHARRSNGAWTGSGVGVAVIDSGLEMSAEFQGRVKAFYDFTNGKTRRRPPSDEYGHGTHVAGTIAGSGALSNKSDYRGLAPNVELVVLKVLDGNGAGYTSDVIRAIDFAVANRSKFGIDIINLSLGHPIYEPAATDPLVQAVERASRAGIIVVAAAGNLGVNPDDRPARIRGHHVARQCAVGHHGRRRDDQRHRLPQRRPHPGLQLGRPDVVRRAASSPICVAPGHNIIAVGRQEEHDLQELPAAARADADYIRLSGTSMATAVSSGVVALMIEAHRATHPGTRRALTPNTVKAMLQYTAFAVRNDIGLEYDPLREGAGALNGAGRDRASHGRWTRRPRRALLAARRAAAVDDDRRRELLRGIRRVIWGSAVIWGSTVPSTRPRGATR